MTCRRRGPRRPIHNTSRSGPRAARWHDTGAQGDAAWRGGRAAGKRAAPQRSTQDEAVLAQHLQLYHCTPIPHLRPTAARHRPRAHTRTDAWRWRVISTSFFLVLLFCWVPRNSFGMLFCDLISHITQRTAAAATGPRHQGCLRQCRGRQGQGRVRQCGWRDGRAVRLGCKR